MEVEDFVRIRTERRLLQQIFWECTLRCNLNCLHCGSDCRKNDMPEDMPFEDFAKVLDEVSLAKDPSQILIVTTGGEPLVRKDIVDCGRAITGRGFRWGMVSNGMLLTKPMLDELLDAGLVTIAISLDGFEDEHNWMRGNKESFRRAVGAIKAIEEASRHRPLAWDVITCANARNIGSLERFKDYLLSIGVSRWRIFSVFPLGRAADNADMQLSPEQFRELMQFVLKVRSSGEMRLSYSCEGYLGPYEMRLRDLPFFCGAGINVASVRYDGAISGCLSIRSHFDQGNIYKDSFMDVWNNRFEMYRDHEWMKTDACATCEVWKVCRGGAMHLRNEEGKMLSCSFLKLNS